MQNIQLSGDSFSCFIQLPIELKASPLNGSLVLSTDTATWTMDNQQIQANSIDCSPVRMRGVKR